MKQKFDYKRKAQLYPTLPVVIGTVYDGKPNWSTIAWHGILGYETILITVASSHLTAKAIEQNKCFSVNIPDASDNHRVDYVGTHSGNRCDKSQKYEYSLVDTLIPIIDEYKLSYTCEVIEIKEKNGESYIIAKVKDLYADESIIDDKSINIKKLNPLLFDWSGYYTLGEYCGEPYSTGKEP